MAEAEVVIRHPALDGEPWPAVGVRVRREDRLLRAASWTTAPLAVQQDVLLPCTWPELERLAEVAAGQSRARVYVRDLAAAGPDGRLVLCLRGAPGAVRVQGRLAPGAEVLGARARAAALRVAAVHRAAGRQEDAQLWSARGRRLLRIIQSARRGRSVRTSSAGLPTLGGRP